MAADNSTNVWKSKKLVWLHSSRQGRHGKGGEIVQLVFASDATSFCPQVA